MTYLGQVKCKKKDTYVRRGPSPPLKIYKQGHSRPLVWVRVLQVLVRKHSQINAKMWLWRAEHWPWSTFSTPAYAESSKLSKWGNSSISLLPVIIREGVGQLPGPSLEGLQVGMKSLSGSFSKQNHECRNTRTLFGCTVNRQDFTIPCPEGFATSKVSADIYSINIFFLFTHYSFPHFQVDLNQGHRLKNKSP